MKENRRHGVLAGGNWIIDFVKMIDVYPGEEALTNIRAVSSSNGGAPYNVLKALCKLGAGFPLEGIGCVGQDASGVYVLSDCRRMNIEVSQMRVLEGHQTSYTDVMTVRGSGRRTFFHFRGANAFLCRDDFKFAKSNAKIFHLGYLLLLDELDELTEDGLSAAAEVFRMAKEHGFLTSADVVSEQSQRYTELIPPCLPYIDVLFANEYEAGKLADTEIQVVDGVVQLESCRSVAEKIIGMGVNKWVIIHFRNGALAMNKAKESYFQEALKIPEDEIKGSVGAGDAFAAGVLYGMHEEWSIEKSLQLGVCVGASSLMSSGSSGGILNLAGCRDLYKKYNPASKVTF